MLQRRGGTSVKELNATDLSKILDKEFNVMIIKILSGLKKRLEELSETFNIKIENNKRTNPS